MVNLKSKYFTQIFK